MVVLFGKVGLQFVWYYLLGRQKPTVSLDFLITIITFNIKIKLLFFIFIIKKLIALKKLFKNITFNFKIF